ncbi:MAG: DUF4185 domain-containing protein [Armatimonadia bacterium]|nr:DUF4185 domain-containing protein [Armatimonadia bacterium]
MRMLWCLLALLATPALAQPFGVRVVDDATGRGVPLVRLEAVDGTFYITDSAGWVAIDDPVYTGHEVFFHISSHGYEHPEDGFGYRGQALRVTPGGRAEVRVQRLNIAERLYRLTGAGIYVHSLRLGEPVPTRQPLLNGGVVGQDTVLAHEWNDRVLWLFGDTNRLAYPLGLFHTAGAWSEPPEPDVGIDLEYMVGDHGFVRAMCPSEGEGPVWLGGLCAVDDGDGEVLVAHYSRVRGLEALLEHGIAVFDEGDQVFDKHTTFDLERRWQAVEGHPIREGEYLLLPTPFVGARCRATLDAVTDQDAYEAFTCLEPGASFAGAESRIERDGNGEPLWGFKAGTDPVGQMEERELMEAGLIDRDRARFDVRDAETGRQVRLASGSVAWNEYRRRWIMIACESFGDRSFLGEIWYLEADDPTGPWSDAVRVVTHDRYGFYNPVHHPFLDRDGGRRIYFQGTYTQMFEGDVAKTPRYEYNQIMYRLDLADERLRTRE